MSPSSSPNASFDDAELFAAIRVGDERAFHALYTRYAPKLVALATWLSGDGVAVGEDIVHDVFTDVWIRRATLDVRGAPHVYLYQAVRNRASNRRRHEDIVDMVHAVSKRDDAIPGLGDPPDAPDVAVSTADIAATIRALVRTFPPARREVMLLYLDHGLSYEEIAEVMHLSVAAAKMHVARARSALRPVLAPLLGLGVMLMVATGGGR